MISLSSLYCSAIDGYRVLGPAERPSAPTDGLVACCSLAAAVAGLPLRDPALSRVDALAGRSLRGTAALAGRSLRDGAGRSRVAEVGGRCCRCVDGRSADFPEGGPRDALGSSPASPDGAICSSLTRSAGAPASSDEPPKHIAGSQLECDSLNGM